MRPFARPTLALPLAALLPTIAQAQEAPADTSQGPAQAIVVTGRGLIDAPATAAYDVQQIDREKLLLAASGRIEDALSSAAGFQQFRRSDSRSSNPSSQGVTLRALGGNATSRTLVLLDGVPMADPFFGYIPLSAIAPERLASARVTRGGGAGAFGAGAVAGTIELSSANADQLGLVSASALANDRGETETSGTFAPKLGQGFAVVSGRWDRGQGFWTTPVAQRVPASVRARYELVGRHPRRRAGRSRYRASSPSAGLRGQPHPPLRWRGHGIERAGRQPAPDRAGALAVRCSHLRSGPRFQQYRHQLHQLSQDAGPAPHPHNRMGRQGRTAPAGGRRARAAAGHGLARGIGRRDRGCL
jgi:hypothetical protein